MDMTRRDFLVWVPAAACAVGGCAVMNPAPSFDAEADGTMALPDALAKPGSQIKVRLGGETVLVWRTERGFGGASIRCTHKGSEVEWKPGTATLDCPSHGSRFNPDGSVLRDPAKTSLRSHKVTLEGGRLKIAPA